MKRLIVCCDGTWNRPDQEDKGTPSPTNVVRLAFRVAKRDAGVPQILFYDQGVGTGNALDRWTGGAFGAGLLDNIFDAYRFLVANYEAGDRLYVFGFSRGAYTARSLCGMIRKVGILKRASVMDYANALALYRRSDCRPDDEEPKRFRARHSIVGDEPIEISFLGVWDTVGSLGIPLRGLRWITRRKYQFHDTELSGSVKRARHALAIDERRGPFAPTLWSYKPKEGQTVEQSWFIGAHSDVGGGYPRFGLADITLQWMMEGAQQAQLAFDPEVERAHPLKPVPGADVTNSKKGLYRLTPGIDRPIGLCAGTEDDLDPTQDVHDTARNRWHADERYEPPNLGEYLARTKDAPGLQA